MKKTNVILAVVIAIFIICAIIILTVAFINNREKDTVPVNVDFDTLSLNIEESTDLDNSNLQPVTIEDLQTDFGIDASWVVKVIGKRPYVNINSSMYVIVEATDGNVQNVLSAFENYGNDYDKIWKDYLAEEYELVQNREIGSKGNYVYFIVDTYSKEIIDLIK